MQSKFASNTKTYKILNFKRTENIISNRDIVSNIKTVKNYSNLIFILDKL